MVSKSVSCCSWTAFAMILRRSLAVSRSTFTCSACSGRALLDRRGLAQGFAASPTEIGAPMATPRFASSDGLKIAYVEEGGGPPIVFLHGVGATKKMWAPQLAMLSERFRCIALDYRGYGESETPPEASLKADARDAKAISRAAYARDVVAVLDAESIDAAHLCGCSLGGVVALETYDAKPARVKSLALVDTFAFYPGG